MTAHVVGADKQSTVNYLYCDCSVTLPMWSGQTGSPLWITCVVTAAWLCPYGWGRQAVHCELPVLGQTSCSICDCSVTLTTSIGQARKTVGKVARNPAVKVCKKCGSAVSRRLCPKSCRSWPYMPKNAEFMKPNDTSGHDMPRKNPRFWKNNHACFSCFFCFVCFFLQHLSFTT